MSYSARSLALLTLALVALLLASLRPLEKRAPDALPENVKAILQKSCTGDGCHTLADRLRFVRAKNLNGSDLYQRLIIANTNKRMPLGGDPLPKEQIEAIKEWIEAGAAGAGLPQPEPLVTDNEVIGRIAVDLDAPQRRDDSRFFRYIVLNHLYNSGATPQELALWRGGISKLINSLSWGGTVQNPEPVDKEGLILRVDLRHYDWHRENGYQWRLLVSAYPYGIKYRSNLATTVYAATGEAIPFIRGDWFVANASLPPLYDALLRLPDTADDLERKLGVAREQNLKDGIAIRGGMGTGNSKIASQNRVVERHPAVHRYYWRSYDFRKDSGEQNIFTHPLNFKEDGGEIIFGLPNGLQGYLLVDGKGDRIKEGKAPTDIVFNREKENAILLKKVEVFNGLSCMSCHAQGMIGFSDEVRKSLKIPPKDRETVERIYVEQKRMDAELQGDKERFVEAVKKTGAELSSIEPIVALAFQYNGELTLQDAASEVGLKTERFADYLPDLPEREKLVLNPLRSEGGTISRTQWETVFGEVARQLNIGDFIPPKPLPAPPKDEEQQAKANQETKEAPQDTSKKPPVVTSGNLNEIVRMGVAGLKDDFASLREKAPLLNLNGKQYPGHLGEGEHGRYLRYGWKEKPYDEIKQAFLLSNEQRDAIKSAFRDAPTEQFIDAGWREDYLRFPRGLLVIYRYRDGHAGIEFRAGVAKDALHQFKERFPTYSSELGEVSVLRADAEAISWEVKVPTGDSVIYTIPLRKFFGHRAYLYGIERDGKALLGFQTGGTALLTIEDANGARYAHTLEFGIKSKKQAEELEHLLWKVRWLVENVPDK